jgi:hypothetical protein
MAKIIHRMGRLHEPRPTHTHQNSQLQHVLATGDSQGYETISAKTESSKKKKGKQTLENRVNIVTGETLARKKVNECH